MKTLLLLLSCLPLCAQTTYPMLSDTTNGALQFLATGAASETWKWGVSVQTVEVTP